MLGLWWQVVGCAEVAPEPDLQARVTVVKGVDFPPHALPDGERFVYPLHWEG